MKQRSFSIKNKQGFYDSIEKIKQEAQEMENLSSVHVSIYVDRENVCMLEEMKLVILHVFPKAQIIGAASRAGVVNGRMVIHGIIVNFILFEYSEVRCMSFDFGQMSSEQAGRKLLTVLEADKEVVAVGILSAGFHLDINPFFREISKAPSDIAFFGGAADDGSLGQSGMIWTNNTMLQYGVAVVIFSGSKLHIKASSSLGWKPLGRSMTVTKTDGSFCIKEIDNCPAFDVFARYLGIENNDRFGLESLTFPFYFERHGTVLTRHPQRCRADGSILLGADIHAGEKIRLSYGDPGVIIENALTLQEEMALFRPEAIYVVSCVGRWLLLGSDTEKEFSVTRHLAPSMGFYAYGDFMRDAGGEVMVSNMTMVTVGMREGAGDTAKAIEKVTYPQLNAHRSLMAHLIRFIEATNRELEESNAKLEKLAKLDSMTKLFNRGAMNLRLQAMLEQAALCKQPLSVLMMDIDDFKGINDTFGHAMGDTAIEAIAEILRAEMRDNENASSRWGGDEFFVAFCNVDQEGCRLAAKRIHQRVESLDFLPEGKKLTVSIGMVTALPKETVESLYHRVDNALYEAKRSPGKNTVVFG